MTLLGRLIDERVGAPARRMKASAFEELSIQPGAIVFLGDSITEGGAWHEWFPQLRVANRGIGGDRADGVLSRLGTAVQGPPTAVFLLIGTNDLAFGRSPEAIAADVAAIVAGIRTQAPETRVVVQSVMPRHPKYRDRILALNDRYRAIAAEHGAEFLDLWPVLADDEGGLRPDYTLDRLHLNGPAYRAWVSLLTPLLAPGKA